MYATDQFATQKDATPMTDIPTQLTDEDVKRLTAERKYDEIEQAREAGRLDTLLGCPPAHVDLFQRARHGAITAADAAELNRLRRHDLVEQARTENRITDLNPTTEGA